MVVHSILGFLLLATGQPFGAEATSQIPCSELPELQGLSNLPPIYGMCRSVILNSAGLLAGVCRVVLLRTLLNEWQSVLVVVYVVISLGNNTLLQRFQHRASSQSPGKQRGDFIGIN